MNMKNKTKKSAVILFWVLGITLAIYTVSLLTPLVWGILTSLRSRNDWQLNGKFALPATWEFVNYANVWKFFVVNIQAGATTRDVYLPEMLLNSVTYSVGMGILSTFSPCLVAYLCAKFPYKFSRFMYGMVVVLMVIPIVGNMPSLLMIVKTLGIYNTYFGMMCMKFTFANTYFIIFYSTFKGLADGYAEAARIDGASETTIMFRIMFPLVAPTIMAIFLLKMIAMWNDYMTSLIYYPSHPTAALGLLIYNQNNRVSSVPEKLAGATTVIVPLLIVYLSFKKYLMGNLTMGGLKG